MEMEGVLGDKQPGSEDDFGDEKHEVLASVGEKTAELNWNMGAETLVYQAELVRGTETMSEIEADGVEKRGQDVSEVWRRNSGRCG